MIDSFTIEGAWWLPDTPDNKVTGTLSYDPDQGISLNLIGSFKNILDFNRFKDNDIILGVGDQKIITLYKCFEKSSNISSPGVPKTIIDAQYMFIGHHFKKTQELKFNTYSISFSNLHEWLGISGFKYQVQFDDKKLPTEERLTYKTPDFIIYKLNDLTLKFTWTKKSKQDWHSRYSFEEQAFITLSATEARSFHTFQYEIFNHIKEFLSFSTGHPTYPLTIKATTESSFYKTRDGEKAYNSIGVYIPHLAPPLSIKRLHPKDFLFSFLSIKDNFENLINTWFAKKEILSPTFDLYFSTIYNTKMYLQTRFLALAQSLESYHIRIGDGYYTDEHIFQELYTILVNSIPSDISKDFRTSIKNRLKYFNELSLRKRLKDLVSKYAEYIDLLIKDKNIFINDVVNTRNYFTHYDKDLEKKSRHGKDLYKLTIQLKFVIELSFLAELGLPCDLLLKNEYYQYLSIKI